MDSRRLRQGRRRAALTALALALIAGTATFRSVTPRPLLPAGEIPGREESEDEGGPDGRFAAAREAYLERAYPATVIEPERVAGERAAFSTGVARRRAAKTFAVAGPQTRWRELGPSGAASAVVNGLVEPPVVSGRVAALALARTCVPGDCRLYAGTAGGGVWRTDDALAATPSWRDASAGLGSLSIGALAFDPGDPSGDTLYAGTGEAAASFNSQAGVGLYRSADGGASWSLVPGSAAIAHDRSIGTIAIDPRDSRVIYVGTASAWRGNTSVTGAWEVPPGAPALGLYRSGDGGASFTRVFDRPGDGDAKGGVNALALDPSDPGTVYVALYGEGLWRSSPRLDGDAGFRRLFAPAHPEDADGARTEFALAPAGAALRIYVGDTSEVAGTATLWRVDDAERPVTAVAAAWTALSDATPGTPGHTSDGYCVGQCAYDNVVAARPGSPDEVWLGGAVRDPDLFPIGRGPGNQRSVLRSTDGGRQFADVTADVIGFNDRPNPNGTHGDIHAVVFDPGTPGRAFVGSDGGITRVDAPYLDRSQDCDARGLSAGDLTDCRRLLAAVPERIRQLNAGLPTLQFQSVSVDPQDPERVLGGTADNGSIERTPDGSWRKVGGGDGGQSVIAATTPPMLVHTWTRADLEVSFTDGDPGTWLWLGDQLPPNCPADDRPCESQAFYVPLIGDPDEPGTLLTGLQHVWRDRGVADRRAYLEQYCNSAHVQARPEWCGRFAPLGEDLTGTAFGADRTGRVVVALARPAGAPGVLWAATFTGRVFISANANAPPASVRFHRIDGDGGPGRFVSGIAVDPADPWHGWVAYSGYGANTPGHPGHVFEVRVDPSTFRSTWTDRSGDLGDQPLTGIALDASAATLYASTDFGVLRRLVGDGVWEEAAPGLPRVSVPGITLDPGSGHLYAATHGRGVWLLPLRAQAPPEPTPSPSPEATATPRAPGTSPTAVRHAPPRVFVADVAATTGRRIAITGRLEADAGLRSALLDFGDGTTAAVAARSGAFAVAHAFARAGTFTLRISATDADGAAGAATARATIRPAIAVARLTAYARSARTLRIVVRVSAPAALTAVVRDAAGRRLGSARRSVAEASSVALRIRMARGARTPAALVLTTVNRAGRRTVRAPLRQ